MRYGNKCTGRNISVRRAHTLRCILSGSPYHARLRACFAAAGARAEGGRTLTAAMSAIDIALHDVMGKHLRCPVYQLLGGAHRKHVPVYVTCQAAMGEGAIIEAKRLVAEGWPCIRFGGHGIYRSENENDDTAGTSAGVDPLLFEPRESIARTVEWMPRVRAAVGNKTAIGIEYHHRLSVAEAANFIQKLPAGCLDWLEEAIRDESPEAYESLRALTPQPFALGEEFASKWQVTDKVAPSLQLHAQDKAAFACVCTGCSSCRTLRGACAISAVWIFATW